MTTNTLNISISRAIDDRRNTLAQMITERQFRAYPELEKRYGAIGKEKCLQDAEFHLSYLSEAIAAELPALFADYIGWAKVMLAGRGVPADDLAANLEFIREALHESLPEEMAGPACDYLRSGLEQLPDLPSDLPPAPDNSPLAQLADNYLQALLRGERNVASRLILDVVKNGTDVKAIYLDVFQRTQHEIGRLWQMNRLSVAQEHYCTAATQLIISQLYPYIFSSGSNGRTMVAACVGGDLHEIGVRMIADFFEMEGWNTFYVGANTPTPSLVQMVNEEKADLLALSATMTFHVRRVAEVIQTVRASEQGKRIKILVGGYPFNLAPDLWRQIGADACAPDALQAVTIGDDLVAGGER